MKKVPFVALGCILAVNSVFAGMAENDGSVTVKQAKNLSDESYVQVKGWLTQSLNNDKYLLQDETGAVTVKIETDDLNGQTISMYENIKIWGNIDKDDSGITMIDVKTIKKM